MILKSTTYELVASVTPQQQRASDTGEARRSWSWSTLRREEERTRSAGALVRVFEYHLLRLALCAPSFAFASELALL
jgi:hypothetical protein